MLPAPYDFKLYRGDTFRRVIRLRTVLQDGTLGDYADLTGCIPLAQVRSATTTADLIATFATSVLDQVANKGAVEMVLSPAQTDNLPSTSRWDIQLTHPNGDVHTYLAGKITATGQVSEVEA